ncbi:pleckstrin homology domain-containing family H member 3 [Panicum miliaceum]|uniref:Pleckstrin homology domain-containing family H member 3 n=1 Tax=Panicum miliaceum TaxID=4540 RepID=A0A3L6TRW9_PANMI|nr:pleckstrin homology domain-containing family H member 3 [Panicum miliaceum]
MEVPAPGPARKRKDRDAASPPEPAAAPGGDGGNLLLAGLLAHEFLSSGTVLGDRRGPGPKAARATGGAALVLRGGARVPGVVNPAQLAAWAGR